MLDIVQGKAQPGQQWLDAASQRGVTTTDICIGAVCPMALRYQIELLIEEAKNNPDKSSQGFSLDDLKIMQRNAQQVIGAFESEGRIIDASAQVADRWGDLLDQTIEYRDSTTGAPYSIGSVQKLEIATAIIGRNGIGFSYVEREQPGHKDINGLVIVDPTKPF